MKTVAQNTTASPSLIDAVRAEQARVRKALEAGDVEAAKQALEIADDVLDSLEGEAAAVPAGNYQGMIDDAHERLIRAAGLFALVHGAPEGYPPRDAAETFNSEVGELANLLMTMREWLGDATARWETSGPTAAAAEE